MNLRLLFVFSSLLACNISNAQSNPFGVSNAGLDYLTGQALFEKNWVSAPSSTQASDGLGPLYNARSCVQCHMGAGKGRLPIALNFRIDSDYFGSQIQTRAVSGLPAEAESEIAYSNRIETLADNTEVILHEPLYKIITMEDGQGELIKKSPRLAPALFGLGLLDAIPLQELLNKADPDDHDNDGISGIVGTGRFGWKADVANLEEQTGLALSVDIGISSELFPNPFGDCTEQQDYCLLSPHGASREDQNLEIGHVAFASLLNFIRNIPLPVGSEDSAGNNSVGAGEALFENIGCISCHSNSYSTNDSQANNNPYSDLLLHDMGEALADSLDNELSYEWRTPPLWGLSAYIDSQRSNEQEQLYLHDGRARSLVEAILWHDGEARGSKQAFKALSMQDRADLINFLQSI
ncbi:MAG: di-heme oxidoredictase family protein [Gammaproteobacteria bacterium]|nr:di-heme oxidoredictase family protein [Gammaproteobacteria bacterium]